MVSVNDFYPTQLKELVLTSTLTEGDIPTEIGLLTSLTTLNLSYNDGLTGSIPTEILKLKQLRSLDLSFTPNLKFQLPPNFVTELKNLQFISIYFSGIDDTCDDIDILHGTTFNNSIPSFLICCDDSNSNN